ncbi:hypothetical protein RFI_17698 [Reticulomyxa filosa]|uniref:Uncharacterized protein n=1 Tax=Reticulomyxa filosa TaxID=46433 RepID=X6N2J5_RETFI|nr:hypothetical protein RFI_17698 [Reticulomyxa filosa]|eukprot:ETO19532.1 hypothetical protein RFI_17698 [Reticulomyxa filosa]
MIFYDIKWTQATSTEQWKKLLNPKIGQHNWFIKHRFTYGRLHFTGRVTYLALFIAAVALGVALWKDIYIAYGIYFFLFITPYIGISFLWKFVPTFEDSFLVLCFHFWNTIHTQVIHIHVHIHIHIWYEGHKKKKYVHTHIHTKKPKKKKVMEELSKVFRVVTGSVLCLLGQVAIDAFVAEPCTRYYFVAIFCGGFCVQIILYWNTRIGLF